MVSGGAPAAAQRSRFRSYSPPDTSQQYVQACGAGGAYMCRRDMSELQGWTLPRPPTPPNLLPGPQNCRTASVLHSICCHYPMRAIKHPVNRKGACKGPAKECQAKKPASSSSIRQNSVRVRMTPRAANDERTKTLRGKGVHEHTRVVAPTSRFQPREGRHPHAGAGPVPATINATTLSPRPAAPREQIQALALEAGPSPASLQPPTQW